MNDYWIDIARILIPGALIATLSAIITVKLAIRRFHEEKWWEKKEAAYTSLFEVMHRLKNYAVQHYEQELDPGSFSKEYMKELEVEWQKASREYAKLRDLASFHLSDGALAVLEKFDNQKQKARNKFDLFLWIEGDLEAVTECLEQLKLAAKKDLKVR